MLGFVRSHTQIDRPLHHLILKVKEPIDLLLPPGRDGFPQPKGYGSGMSQDRDTRCRVRLIVSLS